MVPLLRAGDKTRSLKEIRVGVVDDPDINAANAGGGEFYITTGLLQKANDEHLRGILAHEIAHDDLGHVAKAQVLGTGLNLGVILLEQIIPGSSAIIDALAWVMQSSPADGGGFLSTHPATQDRIAALRQVK